MAQPPSGTRRPRASDGFTIIELMLSVSLTSMLMIALIQAFQSFGGQLETLRDRQVDLALEERLVQVTNDLRNAWTVEEIAPDHLQLSDPYGNLTEYYLSGEDLMVKRPSGATGILVSGIASLGVTPETIQRLRADANTTSYETWFAEAPAGGSLALTLEQEIPLALGFTLSSNAPEDMSSVEGVSEKALEAEIGRLLTPLAFVDPVVEDIEEEEEESNGNSGNNGNNSGNNNGNSGKVTICHIPPGNPSNAHTISVGSGAVDCPPRPWRHAGQLLRRAPLSSPTRTTAS